MATNNKLNSSRGGYRIGSGRKPLPKNELKKMVSIRLPQYLIDWMRRQGQSQSVLIEAALVEKHKLK